MMHFSVKDSGSLGILTLRGNLTEHHAEELRAYLARGLDRVNRLIVNCEQVTSVDMICLKQLCTAYRVSRIFKKDFSLAGDYMTLFQSAVESAGYARCMEAGLACGMGCLCENSDPCRYYRSDTSTSAPAQDIAEA